MGMHKFYLGDKYVDTDYRQTKIMTYITDLYLLFLEVQRAIESKQDILTIRRAIRNFRGQLLESSVHTAKHFLMNHPVKWIIHLPLTFDVSPTNDGLADMEECLNRMECIEWVMGYAHDQKLLPVIEEKQK